MTEITGSQNEAKNHNKWHHNKLIYGTNDEESIFSSCTYIEN